MVALTPFLPRACIENRPPSNGPHLVNGPPLVLLPHPVSVAEARQNHLLRALPEAELLRWLPELQRVDLPLGKAL